MDPYELRMAATMHVAAEPAVLLAVFLGELPGNVEEDDTPEGRLVWHSLADLSDPEIPFLSDVRAILPRLVTRGPDEPVVHMASTPR